MDTQLTEQDTNKISEEILSIVNDTIDQMIEDKTSNLSEVKSITIKDSVIQSETAVLIATDNSDSNQDTDTLQIDMTPNNTTTFKVDEAENKSASDFDLESMKEAAESASSGTDIYKEVDEEISSDGSTSKHMYKEERELEERKKKLLEGQDLFNQTLNEIGTLANEGEAKQNQQMSEDVLCVYQIMSLIRKNRGAIDFSVYNKLTPSLKEKVRRAASANNVYGSTNIQMFAKLMFSQLYQDSEIDMAWNKLQDDIKQANRMPEHMDIFGSVIYNKMVRQGLLQVHMGHEADPEKIDIESNGLTMVARLTNSCWYLEPLYMAVLLNRTRFRKYEKKYKTNVQDIEYIFNKFDIKSSTQNTPKKLFDLLYEHTKTINAKAAYYLAAAMCYALEMNKSEERNYIVLQFIFMQSLVLGVLAYINPDEEVQTEEGKLLWTNFNRFIGFCETVLNSDWENNLVSFIIDAPQAVVDIFNTITYDANQQFETEKAKAAERCKEEMALKKESDTVTSDTTVESDTIKAVITTDTAVNESATLIVDPSVKDELLLDPATDTLTINELTDIISKAKHQAMGY